MKFSPKFIAKIAGGVIGVGICAVAFLWLRSTYSIQGTVQIDTGIEVRQAVQTDVILIQGFVTQDLEQLVLEYNKFKDEQTKKTITQLLKKSKENGGTKKEEPKIEIKEEKVNLVILTDEAEKEIVTKRIREYAENAIYCREEVPLIKEGQEFYKKAATFWEEKISNLKDFDKLVVDDASLNYETAWLPGGLGSENIQVVRAIIRTNLVSVDISKPILEIPEEKPSPPEKPKIDEVFPGSFLTEKEVKDFAVALNKSLKSEYKTIARKSSDLILSMTIEQTKTDEKGLFVFDNKVIQPGKYLIYTKFDILSMEGIPVEFMWFYPVNISMKKLAFDKTTFINLDELNQSKPPYLNIYLPENEEIFLKLLDTLEKEIKNKKNNNKPENIIDELLMSE